MKYGAWTRITTAAACGATTLALASLAGGCAPQNAAAGGEADAGQLGDVWVQAAGDEAADDEAADDRVAAAQAEADDKAEPEPATEAEPTPEPEPAAAQAEPEPAELPAATTSTGNRKTFIGTDTGAGFPASSYVDAAELSAMVKDGVAFTGLDIRWTQNYGALHAAGTLNIPEQQIPARYDEIPTGQPIVLIADTNNSLAQARDYLVEAGFDAADILALDGGIANIWSVYGMRMESDEVIESCCG